MNRIFLIADTHFGHANIIKYEAKNRPFQNLKDHDEELVRRWNDKVKKTDTVWILGDVLFGRESFETIKLLNGRKKLVLGNHDHYPIHLYSECFDKIVGCTVLRECIVTHIPIHPSQFDRFRANIHGHLHSQTIEDRRYINVSAECINLTPITLNEIMEKL